MNEQGNEGPPLRGSVSSAVFPKHNRLNSWREIFGRQFLRLDIDPLDDGPFHYHARYTALPGLTISAGNVSAIECKRTPELIQDNNDDLVLLTPRRGSMLIRERGMEAVIGPGDAIVRRSSEVGHTRSTSGEFLTVAIPYTAMASRVLDIDRLGFAVIPRENATLQLLRGHLDMLLDGTLGPASTEGDESVLAMAARHVHEVAGLLLDTSRDNWARMSGRDGGLHAARLAAIRADVARHATDPEYSIADVARQHGISPGYIRKLLASQGERFSDLLRTERLERAYRLLADPGNDRVTITDIAYHCGFSDVSYFNRCFRQRYAATPGEVRSARGLLRD